MEDLISRLFSARDRIHRVFNEEVESLLETLHRSALDAEAFRRLAGDMGSRMQPQSPESKPDPYSVLGLMKTATDEEIKTRYREMLFKLHPDTAGTPGTGYICQLITEAYRQIASERGF